MKKTSPGQPRLTPCLTPTLRLNHRHAPLAPAGILAIAALLLPPAAFAQALPPPAIPTAPASTAASTATATAAPIPVATTPAPAKPADDIVQLSPFEVRTDRDTSYGALNSTSLTRFNVELDKTPLTADIFTEKFLDDMGATTLNDMLAAYGASSGMAFNLPGDSNLNQPGDRPTNGDNYSSPPMKARGLSIGQPRRDGFINEATNISNTDLFDVERVEVLRGPQGLLYGASAPGGLINMASKSAKFNRNTAKAQLLIDRYGSVRAWLNANIGARNAALTFSILHGDSQQRRTYIGNITNAYYGQLAFKLPLRSILRITGEYSVDKRVLPTDMTVSLGANDSRTNKRLSYLLVTDQINSGTDPATGQPSPIGPIDRGQINWDNYASLLGKANMDNFTIGWYQGTLDTTWTKWLSSSFGYKESRSKELRRTSGGGTLYAPNSLAPATGNPYDDWAVFHGIRDGFNARKWRQFRASLMTDFRLGRLARLQTAGGYDYSWMGTGQTDSAYFLADTDGSVHMNLNSTASPGLGRTVLPNQWWPIGNGIVKDPLPPLGAPMITGADGNAYVRQPTNPRIAQYVTDANPYGFANATSPAHSVLSAYNNADGYLWQQQQTDALWLGNYITWWDDAANTFAGYRRTTTHVPMLSGGTRLPGPSTTNNSYNLGIVLRATSWLRPYFSYSTTFDNPFGYNDPIGGLPPTSSARGWETGIKFTPRDSKISGVLSYYRTNAYKQSTHFDGGTGTLTGVVGSINPTGMNGTWRGPNNTAREAWIPLDQKSSGLELNLTAEVKKGWSIRFSATRSDGRILETKKYAILYNDMFVTDNAYQGVNATRDPVTHEFEPVTLYGRGNVYYKKSNGDLGDPFMVPNPANTAALKALANITSNQTTQAQVNGILSTDPVQLTTDMMSDPNSPYYVWKDTSGSPVVNANGQINSSQQGTVRSLVGNALYYFKPGGATPLAGAATLGQPISAIQYDWPDPNHTGGQVLVAKNGDVLTGNPLYKITLQSSYQFQRGWIKGLGVVVAANYGWDWRTYYYNNPDGARLLYGQPSLWQINLNLYYQRKLWNGRIVWRSQLNITNIFNHYIISTTPAINGGYTDLTQVNFRWDGQPRVWSWSNSIEF